MPKTNIKVKKTGLWAGGGAAILAIIIAMIIALITGQDFEATIEYGNQEEAPEALIENEEGIIEEVDVPTVEEVNTEQQVTEPEDMPDVGLGAYHDTSSFTAYKNAVLGSCVDIDGKYGAQCFDLASDFWKNYTGRWLSSCGTGAAKGVTNCWQQNAGNEFVMVWDKTKIQAGDWIVFDSGQYGHIGMAMGNYNNGYVTLLGQNQGGQACSGGGSKANIININLASFKGAFRPKTYVKPAPKPTPAPKPAPKPVTTVGCPIGTKIAVKKGDTMGKIMAKCEGKVQWGKAMDAYAQTWVSRVVKPNQIVYDGWNSKTGVGLFAGDTIQRVK